MVVSLVAIVDTVIPFPLVTATPPVVQVAVGELIKPVTVLDTVQERLWTIPALVVLELLTVAVRELGETERKEKNVNSGGYHIKGQGGACNS